MDTAQRALAGAGLCGSHACGSGRGAPAVKVRSIMRYDSHNKLFRVGSLLWDKSRPGHRYKLTLGLRAKWFVWAPQHDGFFVVLAGVRLHFKHHPYGGLV